MGAKPAVRIQGLSHQYQSANTRPILDNLSLTLPAGETLALVGASGSGKSTLLNVIGGLEPVQQGEVFVFEHMMHSASDNTRTALRRNTVGFVYQAFNLIPTLSVVDNIRLPLALAGIDRDEQSPRIDRLLRVVGLEERCDAFPDALSGGEQQRVAIARAVVHQPPLLLADEPTGNLDASTGQQVMKLLQSLVADLKTTLLMVTHSEQVANCADRVLAMQDGRLITLNENSTSSTW